MFEKAAKEHAEKILKGLHVMNGREWAIHDVTFKDGVELGYSNGLKDGVELGYSKGLEAGWPEWHDLRKNPDGLPPIYDSRASLSKNVFLDIGIIGYYSYNQKRWCVSVGHRIIKGVIAWCEIPRFEEE